MPPPQLTPRGTLVLAAHPDDEALGCFTWLQRCPRPLTVAFLTDGAPPAAWRPPQFPVRRRYRALRREEALAVLRLLPGPVYPFFAPIPDQQLAPRLSDAAAWLTRLATRVRPALLLAPAFEGGHMDHDAANLLAAHLADTLGIEALEYAIYTAHQGQIERQCFPSEPRWTVSLDATATALKRTALSCYASQSTTLADFRCGQEAIRPLPCHDYTRPPLAEPCVYELWGWPWRAADVALQFSAFLRGCNACAS